MLSIKNISYWAWFFKGSGAKAGYKRIFNCWIWIHLIIGLLLSLLTDVNLEIAANTILLPLVGILVGLTFAWGGNAFILLQSEEIEELSNHHEGGFIEYVFVYQTAILIILITLILWGLAGLRIFDRLFPQNIYPLIYFVIKVFLFSCVSLTLRECWHVVKGTHWLLIIQKEIKKKNNKTAHMKE